MADDFDWSDGETVAVRTQMGLAVYTNPHGDVVIRQEGQFHPDEDTWIVIDPRHAAVIARRILEVAGIEPVDAFPDVWTMALHDVGNSVGTSRGPKDRTKAERQKRYRQRLKTKENVTRDGAETSPETPRATPQATPQATGVTRPGAFLLKAVANG